MFFFNTKRKMGRKYLFIAENSQDKWFCFHTTDCLLNNSFRKYDVYHVNKWSLYIQTFRLRLNVL